MIRQLLLVPVLVVMFAVHYLRRALRETWTTTPEATDAD